MRAWSAEFEWNSHRRQALHNECELGALLHQLLPAQFTNCLHIGLARRGFERYRYGVHELAAGVPLQSIVGPGFQVKDRSHPRARLLPDLASVMQVAYSLIQGTNVVMTPDNGYGLVLQHWDLHAENVNIAGNRAVFLDYDSAMPCSVSKRMRKRSEFIRHCGRRTEAKVCSGQQLIAYKVLHLLFLLIDCSLHSQSKQNEHFDYFGGLLPFGSECFGGPHRGHPDSFEATCSCLAGYIRFGGSFAFAGWAARAHAVSYVSNVTLSRMCSPYRIDFVLARRFAQSLAASLVVLSLGEMEPPFFSALWRLRRFLPRMSL